MLRYLKIEVIHSSKCSSVFHGDLCSNLIRYVSCLIQSIHGYLTGIVRGNLVEVIWLKLLGGIRGTCVLVKSVLSSCLVWLYARIKRELI